MKKAIAAIIAGLAAVTLLSACGTAQNAANAPAQTQSQAAKEKASIHDLVGHEWKAAGHKFDFTTKVDPDPTESYDRTFPDAISKSEQTHQYVLKVDGVEIPEENNENGSSGRFYAASSYLPTDLEDTNGAWHQQLDIFYFCVSVLPHESCFIGQFTNGSKEFSLRNADDNGIDFGLLEPQNDPALANPNDASLDNYAQINGGQVIFSRVN